MAKKKTTTNPAVITFDDFMFYVIYTREHGYGVSNHRDLCANARTDFDGVETIGRFKETEWCPVSESESGVAHIKRTGLCTAKGIEKLIDNIGCDNVDETGGALTVEFGLLPAISLSTDTSICAYNADKEDLKRIFKNKYFDGIYEMYHTYYVNMYVSVMIHPLRIAHMIYALYGVDAYDLLNDKQKRHIDNVMKHIYGLEDRLDDWLRYLADGYHYDEVKIDPPDFVVDARQMELFDFDETA